MHQKSICLCPKCLSVLCADDDESRVLAKVAIACTGTWRSRLERIGNGVVRRYSRLN